MRSQDSFTACVSYLYAIAALDGPAIWTARIEDGKVSEWRLYEDTPANRARLGIAEENR